MSSVRIAPITEENFRKVDPNTLKPSRPDVVNNRLEILAGPILRYWGLAEHGSVWRGSATYVTRDERSDYEHFPTFTIGGEALGAPFKITTIEGITFWRFDFDVPTHETQSTQYSYRLGEEHPEFAFWVPGQNETMRTMFYSCNGFSLSVDTKEFPGSLWDDVLRKHKSKDQPFHVMLGGGDQLYCDSVNLVLPQNALKDRGAIPEVEKMKDLLNKFYLHQYVDWYGRGYWKGINGETYQTGWVEALATIPSLNIYDDHDIIDGYGTYRDSTMRSPIFEMLGDYAYCYYMLFQQNVGRKDDPKLADSSWIATGRPGTYIHEPARSIYAQLGKSAAFLGLDCRTERKLDQVVRSDSYDAAFKRIEYEVSQNPDIKHLYLMLGVPIAYPRLVWLENLMSSRMIGLIKWFSKKGIFLKGLVNPFDGDVELLDDLNDHWCAKHHKRERNRFLERLFAFQRKHSVRVTILTGDVHLCAVGIFQSLKHVAPEVDPNFIICPVSSAIVNTPPPSTVADFLNKRNKNHFLHAHVEERMISVFSVDTNGYPRHNKSLLPRRNYCILDPVPAGREPEGKKYAGPAFESVAAKEEPPSHDKGVVVTPGSVRMTLQVEYDNHESDGATVPYEMYIPTLNLK